MMTPYQCPYCQMIVKVNSQRAQVAHVCPRNRRRDSVFVRIVEDAPDPQLHAG